MRCVLLLLVVLAMEGVYIIEQPSSSLLLLHERMVWFVDLMEELGMKDPCL